MTLEKKLIFENRKLLNLYFYSGISVDINKIIIADFKSREKTLKFLYENFKNIKIINNQDNKIIIDLAEPIEVNINYTILLKNLEMIEGELTLNFYNIFGIISGILQIKKDGKNWFIISYYPSYGICNNFPKKINLDNYRITELNINYNGSFINVNVKK